MSSFLINPYVFATGVDLKTNLLHYWDLDATAATMSDLHGSLDLARGGTVNTNSTGAPDGGSCVEMSTTGTGGGHFSASNIAPLAAYSSAVTINIWVRSTSDPTTGCWTISHRNSSFAAGIYFQIRTRGASDSADVGSIANTTQFFTVSSTEEALNQWQMLTLRKDGNDIEFFRNASSLGTNTFSGSLATANAPFSIGTASWDQFNPNLSHRGQLFAAGIWEEALSTEQIDALYNGGDGLRYADLP